MFSNLLGRMRVIHIFSIAIIIRTVLLLITPASLLIDGIARYIPDAENFLKGDFSSWSPPLYSLILTIPEFILSNNFRTMGFQLISLILFGLSFYEGRKLLTNFELSKNRIKVVLILWSLMTWNLILSVAIIPDMLFTYLFLVIANRLFIEKYNLKDYFVIALLTLLFVSTKPMAFIIIPGLILFKYLHEKNLSTTFKTTGSFITGCLVFLPWLIKNYINTGTFFETIGTQETSATFKFIEISQFLPQLEKSFAYFWEFPAFEKIQAFSTTFSNPLISNLIQVYYFVNVIFFLLLTVFLIYSAIKLFQQEKKKFLMLACLILPCLLFSTAYFPFFSKYNYWDTGRYSFPVLILIISVIFFVKYNFTRIPKSILFLGLSAIVLLSIINGFMIVYTIRNNYLNTKNVLLKLEEKYDLEKYSTLSGNDLFTNQVLSYESNKTFVYDDGANCVSEILITDYSVCTSETKLIVIKNGALSRNTR